MERILALCTLLALGGCGTSGEADSLQALLDRLAFEEGESGCVDIRGEIALGGNPFAGASANVVYKKRTGSDAPQC